MAEIRSLIEEVGTDDAKRIYNRLRERYAAPPSPGGGQVAESARVEAGGSAPVTPQTTAELEQMRGLVNQARSQAGLEPLAAPDPNEALRSRSPTEAAASSAIELRP